MKDVKLTKKQLAEQEKQAAIAQLLEILKPGATVYTELKRVSKSGMSRVISLKAVHDGEIITLDYLASQATGYRLDSNCGLKVTGCGMDMGFHVVYVLGNALWPHGTPEPHGSRNGIPDTCGGYALKHRWL